MPKVRPIKWTKVYKWRVGVHRWTKTHHLFIQEPSNYWRTRCGIRFLETNKDFKNYRFWEWDGVLNLNPMCAHCERLYLADQQQVCGHEWEGRINASHKHQCAQVHEKLDFQRHNCWCGTQTEKRES